MCGYCIEEIVLDLVKEEQITGRPVSSDYLVSPFIQIYAQETSYLSECMQQAISTGDITDIIGVFHCRALWEVFIGGSPSFHTGPVQNILSENSELYIKAMARLYSMEKFAPFLICPSWINLYRPEIVLETSERNRFLWKADHMNAAVQQLENYCSLWLSNHSAGEKNPWRFWKKGEYGFQVSASGHEDSTYRWLHMIEPCLHFALNLISTDSCHSTLLKRIAMNFPLGMPDFSGKDLWISRNSLAQLSKYKT